MMDVPHHFGLRIEGVHPTVGKGVGEAEGEVSRTGAKIDQHLATLKLKGLHHFIGFLPFRSIRPFEKGDVLLNLLERLEGVRIDPRLSQRTFDGRKVFLFFRNGRGNP
jgi:hypothetical protein